MNMTRDQLRAINPAAAAQLDEDDRRKAARFGAGRIGGVDYVGEIISEESFPPSSPTPAEKTPPRPKDGAPRIRQRKDGDGKNKLERAFGEYLQMSRRLCTRNLEMMLGADAETMIVRFNAVSFELANGLRFKPDYTANLSHAWEVKGPWASRDAFPRLKMAARLFPEIKWFLATRRKGDGWDIQHILS